MTSRSQEDDLKCDTNFITFENREIGRRGIINAVSRIPGVHIELSKWWYPIFGKDVFCEFSYQGKAFEIEDLRGENWWFCITEKNLLESKNELKLLRRTLAI